MKAKIGVPLKVFGQYRSEYLTKIVELPCKPCVGEQVEIGDVEITVKYVSIITESDDDYDLSIEAETKEYGEYEPEACEAKIEEMKSAGWN